MAAEFRFNFQSQEANENDKINDEKESYTELQRAREAKEIKVDREFTIPGKTKVEKLIFGRLCTEHLSVQEVEEKLKTYINEFSNAVGQNTDLVPDIYEGGLKIWECARDLVEFLIESSVDLRNARCLELGCGAGLPGIFALLQGANVDFQDYNEEVIEHFTIPNVLLNLKPKETDIDKAKDVYTRCRFFSGDWKKLEQFINQSKHEDQKYDIILTAETIYNVDNYSKLLEFFKAHLKRPDGVVYLAAKTYYFGVGGGTRSFEEKVKEMGCFNVRVGKTFVEGMQREILILTWKSTL